jgi:hypothetical protein
MPQIIEHPSNLMRAGTAIPLLPLNMGALIVRLSGRIGYRAGSVVRTCAHGLSLDPVHTLPHTYGNVIEEAISDSAEPP